VIIQKADDKIIDYLLEKYPGAGSVICTEDNGYTLVAIENDTIIAFTSVLRREIPAPLHSKIEDFIEVIDVVDIPSQGKGVGSALVSEVKRIALEAGSMQVRAYCDIQNEASHALWVKNGFGISPVKNANGTIPGSFVTYRLTKDE
jgi:RimJ/RimL family protein N-acetyltransferase